MVLLASSRWYHCLRPNAAPFRVPRCLHLRPAFSANRAQHEAVSPRRRSSKLRQCRECSASVLPKHHQHRCANRAAQVCHLCCAIRLTEFRPSRKKLESVLDSRPLATARSKGAPAPFVEPCKCLCPNQTRRKRAINRRQNSSANDPIHPRQAVRFRVVGSRAIRLLRALSLALP